MRPAGERRTARRGLALAALLVAGVAARADDVVEPLAERIRAAPLIVEGEAGRSYAAWNGADPATIVTYTPFSVSRLLKGTLPQAAIVLRQRGGAIGGVDAAAPGAAQFDDGEHAFVFVGPADPGDASYDVVGGAQGKYRITTDAQGHAGLDVRLGGDAAAFSPRDKAPGTSLARIPADLFVALAQGAPIGAPLAGGDEVPAADRAGGAPPPAPRADAAARGGGWSRSASRALVLIAAAVAAVILVRRRRRGSAAD